MIIINQSLKDKEYKSRLDWLRENNIDCYSHQKHLLSSDEMDRAFHQYYAQANQGIPTSNQIASQYNPAMQANLANQSYQYQCAMQAPAQSLQARPYMFGSYEVYGPKYDYVFVFASNEDAVHFKLVW